MLASGATSTFCIWSFPFGVAGMASQSLIDRWRGAVVWDIAADYYWMVELSYLVVMSIHGACFRH